ncbi:MAG: cytidylate kinase-like family protein [Clostridia bacterium]|nr:cytidylate kinase-like family protein [Clostridia bacterium]NCD01639.1 cytidylate kinase-like family protein [Clostridia bacterium]
MKHFVITISREFGSGGRLIGKALAERMGIDFYDKEMIHMLMEESGFTRETIEEWQEKKTSSFLYNLYMSTQERPLSDQIYLAKTKIVSELAEKSSCVIVGNCGDYILRDRDDVLSFFVYAPLEERMERVLKVYGENKDNNPNYVKKRDKQRSDYYNHFTMNRFGDYHNFDACINTTGGLELATDVLESMIKGIFGGTEDESGSNCTEGK